MSRPRKLPDTPAITKHRKMDIERYYRSDPILGWAKTALNNARKRARRKNIKFSLTLQDVLAAAAGVTHCPITRQLLLYVRGAGVLPNAASIDRFDNDEDYTPETIAVISMWANLLKSNASLDEMIALGQYAMLMKKRVG